MTATKPEPRWMTPRDIATDLRRSPDSVLRLIHTGELPAVDVGTPRKPAYRVRATDYDRWLKARAHHPEI